MSSQKSERNFLVLRLAEGPLTDDPALALKRMVAELSERLDQHNAFEKGHFVVWKPGLKNRRHPDYGEPAIVRSVLPSPTFDPSENNAASPYFQEPLNLVIAYFLEDDLLEYRVDGRRFEHVHD